mgnify:CR=1 FL=1
MIYYMILYDIYIICAFYRTVTEDRTAVFTSGKGGQLHILDKIVQFGRLK